MADFEHILFDPSTIKNLLPLAYTRAIADFRVGIFTIREKWQRYLASPLQILTRDYLQKKYDYRPEALDRIFINSAVLPDEKLIIAIEQLELHQVLKTPKGKIIAYRGNNQYDTLDHLYHTFAHANEVLYQEKCSTINFNWDVFFLNGEQILADTKLLPKMNNNRQLENTLKTINKENIFVGEDTTIEACILNASAGPIYIGTGAKILDGAIIKGPTVIGEHAVIKAGAKIYGETTIGPYCKVGGEVSNCVFFGYSNKGHDGYLGNSVIGEWCNLGADTNTSNLKNNYSLVKSWSYEENAYINTGLQFCGLIMGDHSKCSINTMFNTATVVGVAANIFGAGFPPKFIPSFSWGGSDNIITFKLDKAFEMAENMMQRRHISLNETDKRILEKIFLTDQKFRA